MGVTRVGALGYLPAWLLQKGGVFGVIDLGGAVMSGASFAKAWGYKLRAPDSADAAQLLAERKLTLADLDHALAELKRTEGVSVRTIVGLNDDGVFGVDRAGWHADLPDAYARPLIPVLWIQIAELLGHVPRGSAAQVLDDVTSSGRALNRAWRPWSLWPSLESAS